MTTDIRWQQRFSNFCRALEQLEAFRVQLIEDGEGWMRMIQDRNLTTHTYNRITAEEIGAQIEQPYLACFQALRRRLRERERKA
jgi:nucleotidyltransferase substrate binding protein (TIGR01987 family)